MVPNYQEFLAWLERQFGRMFVCSPDAFWQETDRATAKVIEVVNGQMIEFFLIWTVKNRLWLLSEIRRDQDNLSVFKADEYFPDREFGLYIQFRLVAYNGRLKLAVFGDRNHEGLNLRHVFPLEDMVPKHEETKEFNRLVMEGEEYDLLGSMSLIERIELKEAVAAQEKVGHMYLPFEEQWLDHLHIRRAAEQAEENRRRLEELRLEQERLEQERREREARRQAKKELLMARPILTVYQGEKPLSGIPIDVAEYRGEEHCVLDDNAAVLVFEFYHAESGVGKDPLKAFYFRKDRSGRTVELGVHEGGLSLERPRRQKDEKVQQVKRLLVVFDKDPENPQIVRVFPKEELETVKKRGLAQGTMFVYEGKVEVDGRMAVYRQNGDNVDTVGLARLFK